MALYKYSNYVGTSNSDAFDKEHQPGSATPYSAIYRCMGCGREIVSETSKTMPPQNHHQHTVLQGAIRWKMVAYAQHKPK